MIYNQIEFHNVEVLEKNELRPGWMLQRFPGEVRKALGERGRFIAMQSSGCEIRFVTESKNVRVTIAAHELDGDLMVFKGDFFHSCHKLKAGVMTTIHLEEPPLFEKVRKEALKSCRFSPNVWRIFTCNYLAMFYGVDTFGHAIRPPEAGEVPLLRWLAYGSSITHGSAALNNNNSYIQQAARRLGVDMLNLGLSGACQCEREMADFIASRSDWDLTTLELGINMRNSFSVEEFERRAQYLINTVTAKHLNKPVVIIGIYPNYAEYMTEMINETEQDIAFDKVLQEIVSEKNNPNLHIIMGSQIMSDFSSLSCDLLHPADYGHTLMAENLARELNRFLQPSRREI